MAATFVMPATAVRNGAATAVRKVSPTGTSAASVSPVATISVASRPVDCTSASRWARTSKPWMSASRCAAVSTAGAAVSTTRGSSGSPLRCPGCVSRRSRRRPNGAGRRRDMVFPSAAPSHGATDTQRWARGSAIKSRVGDVRLPRIRWRVWYRPYGIDSNRTVVRVFRRRSFEKSRRRSVPIARATGFPEATAMAALGYEKAQYYDRAASNPTSPGGCSS